MVHRVLVLAHRLRRRLESETDWSRRHTRVGLRLQAVEAVLRDALLAHLVRVKVRVRARARVRLRVRVGARARASVHRLRRVHGLIRVLAGVGELNRAGAELELSRAG